MRLTFCRTMSNNMASLPIVVFGTVCLDRLHQVARLPQPGGYVEIDATTQAPGGEAANTAHALHQWGAPVTLVSHSLGEGPDAEALKVLLSVLPLPKLHAPQLPHPVAVCDLYVTPDGTRTMFGRGFRELETLTNLDLIPTPTGAWLTVDGNLGSAAHKAAARAHAAGNHVYWMDVMDEESPQIKPGDVWQTSTDRVGRPGDIQFNLAWISSFLDRYPGRAILSDGANGLVAGGAGYTPRHYPPFPAQTVIDSTGAGDSFRAGMLFTLAQGWAWADCLRFSAAVGCLNCRAVGAHKGLPSQAEAEAWMARWPEVARAYLAGPLAQ